MVTDIGGIPMMQTSGYNYDENGSSTAADVSFVPTTAIPQTNVQDAIAGLGNSISMIDTTNNLLNSMAEVFLESVGGKGDFNNTTGTDNTNAFNTALNKLKSKGGTIKLGKGNFLINEGTINLNTPMICIEGAGRDQTKITTTVLSTIFKSTSAATRLVFKNLSIESSKEANGTIVMVDLASSMYVDFHSVSFYLKKPKAEQYTDICLKLKNCYFTVLNDLRFFGENIPSPDLHVLTGQSTKRLGGLAVYAINNNALFINSMFTYQVGAALVLENEDGATINGISIEHCNRGVELTGDSNKNIIIGVRYETHVEGQYQLLSHGEQFSIKFGKNTYENTNIGVTLVQYNLYHPYNAGVIDLGTSNKYNGTSNSRRSKECYREETVIDNGDFRYIGDNNIPLGWHKYGQTTSMGLSYIQDDLPKGVKKALLISNLYSNAAGVGTKFIYDPSMHESSITIKWLMKRFSGATTGIGRWLVYAPNNTTPAGFSLYRMANIGVDKTLPLLDSEWATYVTRINLSSLNLSEITEITLRFAMYTFEPGEKIGRAHV